ncbi:ABC transporter substrate-binding protein, partial [Amaricoccus solimangrovi]
MTGVITNWAELGRRDVMRLVGAGVFVAGLGGAVVSRAQEGGTLTVALEKIGNPVYAPGLLDTVAKDVATGTFAEGLLRRGEGGALEPMLAESYEVSPDGRTLTFHLRKGIMFHDGAEFTSADVKYTLDTLVVPDSLNFDAGFWRRAVESVETPDAYTAVLHL